MAFVDYLMPFGILIFIFKAKKKVSKKKFEDKFGSLYEGLKVKSVMHLMCTFFFVIRRLLIVFAAILLQNYPGI